MTFACRHGYRHRNAKQIFVDRCCEADVITNEDLHQPNIAATALRQARQSCKSQGMARRHRAPQLDDTAFQRAQEPDQSPPYSAGAPADSESDQSNLLESQAGLDVAASRQP